MPASLKQVEKHKNVQLAITKGHTQINKGSPNPSCIVRMGPNNKARPKPVMSSKTLKGQGILRMAAKGTERTISDNSKIKY
jgi:hypothetical protein